MPKNKQSKKKPYAHHVPQKRKRMERIHLITIAIIAGAAILGALLAVMLFYTPANDNDNAVLDPALHVRTWDAVLTQAEDAYLVYLYRDQCEACERLEPIIADYANANEHDVPIYFVRLDEPAFTQTEPPSWSYDSTRVDRPITPSILTVENGEVVGLPVAFESQVLNYLGRYVPPAND